jgi:hypothetical protein
LTEAIEQDVETVWQISTRAKWRSSLSACRSVLRIVLDTADIVRDGDISPLKRQPLLWQARNDQRSSGEAPRGSGLRIH